MTLTELAPIIATGTATLAACLAAYFAFLNANIQKKIKADDLTRLLRAEIKNLSRHCRIVEREIVLRSPADMAGLATSRFNSGRLMLFDAKDSYILNENLCQDIMQLSLLSRNNDIYIDYLLKEIEGGAISNGEFKARVALIAGRMSGTAGLCGAVLSNLEKFASDPKGYSEPAIDW